MLYVAHSHVSAKHLLEQLLQLASVIAEAHSTFREHFFLKSEVQVPHELERSSPIHQQHGYDSSSAGPRDPVKQVRDLLLAVLLQLQEDVNLNQTSHPAPIQTQHPLGGFPSGLPPPGDEWAVGLW